MDRPKINLNDPRSTNSPRKAILASRVEAAMDTNVELRLKVPSAKDVLKKSNAILKKVSVAHFEEKKHPRDPNGKFAKSSSSKNKGSYSKTDFRSKVIVDGDQGFKDTLIGLALGAMSEVMDVPEDMPQFTVHQADLSLFSARGLYDPGSNEIGVDSNGSGRSLSAIHEIGHWLDFNLKSQHLTTDSKLMDAINNSYLIKLMRGAGDEPGADEKTKSAVSYLTEPTEMFARAYCQYIVSRSSNKTLKKEFNDRQAEEGVQWDDKDFELIGKEFDRLFKTKKRKR